MYNPPNVLDATSITQPLDGDLIHPEGICHDIPLHMDVIPADTCINDILISGEASRVIAISNERRVNHSIIDRRNTHVLQALARLAATNFVQECVEGGYIDVGSRKANLTPAPKVLISNEFDKNFFAHGDTNLGIYANYSSDVSQSIVNSIGRFVNDHRIKKVLARDSLHNPKSYQFFFDLVKSRILNLDTGYIITHQPLT